jgi:hypothetical protein
MYQTLIGIGLIVVGSAIIIFSERIARVTTANRHDLVDTMFLPSLDSSASCVQPH